VVYVVEFVLVLLLLVLASSFWSSIKSRSYIRSILGNQAELERFIKAVGPDRLQRDATELKPVCGSWLQNMDVNSRAHFEALASTRNVCCFFRLLESWWSASISSARLTELPISSSSSSWRFHHHPHPQKVIIWD
jgi:hypothetical protein